MEVPADYISDLLQPQALTTYGSDAQMTSLLDQMDVYVLPVFNIDGYDYTHKNVCGEMKYSVVSSK